MKWKRVNPNGLPTGDTKICAKCMSTKPLSEFYKDKVNASGYRPWCKECMKRDTKALYHGDGSTGKLRNAKILAERANLKRQLVDAAGGCCKRCGYNRSINALDFHHVGEDKDGEITNMITLAVQSKKHVSALMIEVAKCVILCSNCHRELHDGEWSL